jgi:hypothetical protein
MRNWLKSGLLATAFIFVGAARAMPIPQFDKMTVSDRGTYTTLLIKGSVDALTTRGNAHDADKLFALFDSGDGLKQLFHNLDTLRLLNQKQSIDPNDRHPVYEFEQAFALTLKQNNIIIPLNFILTINKDFKPAAQK